jgi:hypothetical protein
MIAFGGQQMLYAAFSKYLKICHHILVAANKRQKVMCPFILAEIIRFFFILSITNHSFDIPGAEAPG